MTPKNPSIILVRPQLPENIGMVARVMHNFGLKDLIVVSPRNNWLNNKSINAAKKATKIIKNIKVYNDLEIDGFAIAVCDEIQVELSRHKSRSFDEMAALGDDLSSFDLVVALSPASQRRALDLTRFFHMKVEYWPIMDPTGIGETRELKLSAYRQSRDQIVGQFSKLWGKPSEL